MLKWIYAPSQLFKTTIDGEEIQGNSAIYFYKKFTVEGKIVSAKIDISARGLYNGYINGEKICDSYLNPGWCDYRKTIRYQTYDVAHLIQEGENAIGCILGNGWFGGCVGLLNQRNYNGSNMLWAVLNIETTTMKYTIATDDSWLYSTGAIKYNDLLNGEFVNALDEIEDFATVDCDTKNFNSVSIFEDDFNLTAQDYELIKCVNCISPTLITVSGERIYDFDKNIVGIINAKVCAKKGTVLRFRYGEEIRINGRIYFDNLRRAKATDYYISNGTDKDNFEPLFTYHGFRYLTVEVLQGELYEINILGKVLTSDLPQTGTFITSSALINGIYDIIENSRSGNFMSIPTDCPQRDERLGWTGDIQVFAKSSLYMNDGLKFLSKYLEDVRNAALENGSIYDLAPYVKEIANNGSNIWGDVIVLLPYELYNFYGDIKVLQDNYNTMVNWMKFLFENVKDGLRINYQNSPGDWLSTEKTDLGYLCTMYTLVCSNYVAEISEILGFDGSLYKNKYLEMKQALLDMYTDGEGRLFQETATGYAIGIYYDILPKNSGEYLWKLISNRKNVMSTGYVGTKMLLPVLCKIGHPEKAYELIQSVEYPSWGYMLTHGATSVWENWNAITTFYGAKVFHDCSMNSFNHFALGSVVEWFYEYVLGIHLQDIAFKKVIIKPYITENAPKWCKGSLKTRNGLISVEWQKCGKSVKYTIDKPEEMEVEFVFENIVRIRCDGNEIKEFNPKAKTTEIIFNLL